MKKRSLAFLLALVLACGLMLGGCSSDGSADVGESGSEGDGAADGERVLTIASPYAIGSLTPWISNSDGDRYVLGNVYEALIESNTGSEDGVEYVPAIAESWEYTDDTTLVFKIRENVYWQTEGNDLFDEKVQVTAHDVKAVFDFVLDENNASTEWGDLYPIIESVEATDDFTFTVRTKQPSAILLNEISGVLIFPIKAIEEDFDLTQQPVGTGAFIFSEYRVDDSVTLTPNPDYRVTPNVDKVVIEIVPDKAVAAIALQNGEVDIVPQILTTDLEAVAADEDLKLIPNSVGWYRYIGFNCSNEIFQDLRVRQAISMAIDFESITETLSGNDFGAQLAVDAYGGGVPPEFEGSDIEAWKAVYEYNPDRAQTLLEDAGWTKGSDGIYEKDGQKLSFAIKCPTNDQNRVKLGEMAATYLKTIGVDASAQPTEWATMTADIAAGNTEMFVMGGGSVVGGMNMLFHSVNTQGTSHNVFYTDETLDTMLEEAYATIDDDARIALLKEAAMRALENKVHAGGYFEYVQIGMNKRVTDFEKSPTLWYSLCNDYRNVGVDGQ
ncbi:MAG TPA: ABC transporter substrate-binding protein [Candidatus Ventrousia excrementavium]|uniref:ABC transporter substrate-binding protein n=1 Tax=Candidatus Ventrousia excrementavium TaxID=2840961 RepID=A0A9D1LMM1_9CLOT|nr:ABC transporter substrate-binding protein [Candidatus Ventrousia excrementavium]